MSFKTILVHADLSHHAPDRFALAAELARVHGAHLVGAAATGVSPLFYPAEQGAFPGGLLDDYFGAMREQLLAALEGFELAVAPTGVNFEKRMVIGDGGEGLSSLARVADLVVLSQDDPDGALTHSDPRLLVYVILNAPRPVLVVPFAGSAYRVPARILVAWNGSRQAAAAVGHALPLLQRATEVVIATFREDHERPAVAGEPGDLLAFLARHGVSARFDQRSEPVDMGHAVSNMAGQIGAELIVMGCFGHTRLREMCLGGVSRTLLRTTSVPLLMAHM